MGSLFLPLDKIVPPALAAAGLPAPVFYDGWQTRARKSGGYDPPGPLGVMWHHTASSPSTSPEGEAVWMCHNSPDRPLANVVIQRDGAVWVLAAGRTNTNGKGGPWRWSRGTVAADTMNDHGFGIELANTGTGESFRAAVIDAAIVVSNALNAACGNDPGDVCTHQAWAPTRKIDPATAGAVQGSWRPSSINASGTWDLDDLIAECRQRAGAPAPHPPDWYPEADDVRYIFTPDGSRGPMIVGAGWRYWARNQDEAGIMAQLYGDPTPMTAAQYDLAAQIHTAPSD